MVCYVLQGTVDLDCHALLLEFKVWNSHYATGKTVQSVSDLV